MRSVNWPSGTNGDGTTSAGRCSTSGRGDARRVPEVPPGGSPRTDAGLLGMRRPAPAAPLPRSSSVETSSSIGHRIFRPAARPASLRDTVDAQTGPVVLAHAVDHGPVAEGGPHADVVVFPHLGLWRVRYQRPGSALMKRLRRLVGLAQEPPVPPCTRERLVQPLQMLDHRQAIHDHQPLNGVRVIHSRAESHQRARSRPTTENRSRPRCRISATTSLAIAPLGRLRMPGCVRQQRRLAVTAQIRADHKRTSPTAAAPPGARSCAYEDGHAAAPPAPPHRRTARAASPRRHQRATYPTSGRSGRSLGDSAALKRLGWLPIRSGTEKREGVVGPSL